MSKSRKNIDSGTFHTKGSSDSIGKSCEREIFRPIEVSETAEYCMYFPFSIPKSGRKRSAHSRRRFNQSFLFYSTVYESPVRQRGFHRLLMDDTSLGDGAQTAPSPLRESFFRTIFSPWERKHRSRSPRRRAPWRSCRSRPSACRCRSGRQWSWWRTEPPERCRFRKRIRCQ